MAKKTAAQQIEELRAEVAALAARVAELEKRPARRRRGEDGEERPKRERQNRQITDDQNLATQSVTTRDPVQRIRLPNGRLVKRVVRPR